MTKQTWLTSSVIVRWDREKVSDRPLPVAGDKYEGVAEFPGRSDDSWSVVIVFQESPNSKYVGRAEITFRAHWAPDDLIANGTRFYIVEKERVAEVEVVGGTVRAVDNPLTTSQTG